MQSISSPQNSSDVRSNFGNFVDSVVRNKPQWFKRNRDNIVTMSSEQLAGILEGLDFNLVYEEDEDGRFVGAIKQIDDVLADGSTLSEMKTELARQLLEYAIDYENNFNRYLSSPNRRQHAGYVTRILLAGTVGEVENLING
jgi:predicted RNase H-like HicB family nuclease